MEEFLIDKVMDITNGISKSTSKLISLKGLLYSVNSSDIDFFSFNQVCFSIEKKEVINLIEKRIEKAEKEKKAQENLLLQIINKKR